MYNCGTQVEQNGEKMSKVEQKYRWWSRGGAKRTQSSRKITISLATLPAKQRWCHNNERKGVIEAC
jgi:hypothetical protein